MFSRSLRQAIAARLTIGASSGAGGEYAATVVSGVALRDVGGEARFLTRGRERGAVFDIEFAFEEALEDAVGVGAEESVHIRKHSGHQREFRVEDLLRSADDHAARV